MRRALLVLVLAAGAFAGGGSAGGPFYLVPSPTTECFKISNCDSVFGPWVIVPAKGEATYLFSCRSRLKFVVGGTDARASSPSIRVWFDGRLGGAIGQPPPSVRDRAILLFHAVSENGKAGSFQPILGCVTLRPASKRATYSTRAVPGSPTSPPLDLRANNFVIKQTSGIVNTRCAPGEKLVGSWHALYLNTSGPPTGSYADAVTIDTVVAGNKLHVSFQAASSLLTPFAPIASLQIGAMCEP